MTLGDQELAAGDARPAVSRPPSRRSAALATLFGTGGSTLITVAQAFLLIPLALGSLGTPLYGAWLAASELLVFVQGFDLGIPNLITQRIGAALGHRDSVTASRWASSGFLLVMLFAVSLGATAGLAAPVVARWADVAPDQRETFILAFRVGTIGSVLLMIHNGLLAIARGVQLTGIINAGQVLAALIGLGVSIVLLHQGYGLWALALGLLARGLVSLLAGACFLTRVLARRLLVPVSPTHRVVREIAVMTPPLAGASAGYLLANNSDLLLVTTIFGPSAAAIYGLTRRAADGVRSLIDAIAWAVYGGFAQLVTADDRHRARGVAQDILVARFAIACLAASVLVAVNQPFVDLLFGPAHFGGVWLTIGFALQMIFGGQSFLANYLYRAAGAVTEGAYLLIVEAVLRVVVVALALAAFGLPAAPFAAALIGALALRLVSSRLNRILPEATIESLGRVRVAAMAVFAVGLVVSVTGVPASWLAVATAALTVGGFGAGLLWIALPDKSSSRSLLVWRIR